MHLVKRKDTENSRKKAMSSPKDEPGWKYGQLTLKIGLFFKGTVEIWFTGLRIRPDTNIELHVYHY